MTAQFLFAAAAKYRGRVLATKNPEFNNFQNGQLKKLGIKTYLEEKWEKYFDVFEKRTSFSPISFNIDLLSPDFQNYNYSALNN